MCIQWRIDISVSFEFPYEIPTFYIIFILTNNQLRLQSFKQSTNDETKISINAEQFTFIALLFQPCWAMVQVKLYITISSWTLAKRTTFTIKVQFTIGMCRYSRHVYFPPLFLIRWCNLKLSHHYLLFDVPNTHYCSHNP